MQSGRIMFRAANSKCRIWTLVTSCQVTCNRELHIWGISSHLCWPMMISSIWTVLACQVTLCIIEISSLDPLRHTWWISESYNNHNVWWITEWSCKLHSQCRNRNWCSILVMRICVSEEHQISLNLIMGVSEWANFISKSWYWELSMRHLMERICGS